MTHKDIYTKFMIEYDKANVTSSYPSLTEYEVATVLDKAYNALIAQKVTGNNARRIGFEMDLKAIEDLSPLIKQATNVTFTNKPKAGKFGSKIDLKTPIAPNVMRTELPDDYLYFLDAYLVYQNDEGPIGSVLAGNKKVPMDGATTRMVPTKLVTHDIASKFFSSAYNIPWIKIPISYIENNTLYVVYDLLNAPRMNQATIVYIKKPNTFVKDLTNVEDGYATFFDGKGPLYEFECNSTVAEELISLAVAFALENVESARLNSKLNMRGLES